MNEGKALAYVKPGGSERRWSPPQGHRPLKPQVEVTTPSKGSLYPSPRQPSGKPKEGAQGFPVQAQGQEHSREERMNRTGFPVATPSFPPRRKELCVR